ncbi:hypothetical protein K1719_016856 [Acacia pycnantha]|nr:hypothetical protein K1719_016856 [Acacia pycnantha]
MGREEETGLAQNRSSSLESEAETRTCEKPNVVYPNHKLDVAVVDDAQVQKNVQRFCFINVRPKDALAAKSLIQDSAKLLEEMDQRLFQISESLREKAINRENVISRLNYLLNYSLYRLKGSIDGKKNLLIHLYKALDIMSFPNSCSTSQEKLIKHKLNFRKQHKMKNLAQEKNLFRDINVSQETNNDSALPKEELSDMLWQIQWKYAHYHHHYKQNKCEKLAEDIKKFKVTRKISKGLKETVRNQVKVICEELMEIRKKKRALEAEIKVAEKELKAKN